ncbi:MAG: DNA replication/repair protein RecF [Chloroflexi bacterium]|nr:DNA replication/repair protein RecF [Chloroflexota bacterium]
MYLASLLLSNFRNYTHAEWKPHPSSNIIHGDNGRGKTNLLEAVYFLATTRSFRAGRDRELISWAATREPIPTARLEGEAVRGQQKLRLEVALMGRKEETAAGNAPSTGPVPLAGVTQRRIRLNGIPRTAADYAGQVNVVLFSSLDIEVIGGAPALRRRYLDDMKSQVDRHYFRALAAYNRVLEQRNHLLRLIQEERAAPDQLEFWDKELMDKGAYLARHRWALVQSVETLARPLHLALTSDAEELAIRYLPNIEGMAPSDDDQRLKGLFAARLRQFQPREIGAGMSLVGPHRDDINFIVNGTNLGTYGSRGQQRTLALSLKLAEARYLQAAVGDTPIVLLDDVLSELDSHRRRFILQALPEYGQVISTTTDLDRFEPSFLAAAKVFRVSAGEIAAE